MLSLRSSTSRAQIWLAAFPLLFCVGCSSGNSLNPVQGKVLYKDQPLQGVLVSFHPKAGSDLNTVMPTGVTTEDGTFDVLTGDIPGAAAGEYILTLTCSEEVKRPDGKPTPMGMGAEYEDRFKGAYARREASKIQIEVKPGSNELEVIHLK